MTSQQLEVQASGCELAREKRPCDAVVSGRQAACTSPPCDLCAVLRQRVNHPYHHRPPPGRGHELRIALLDDAEDTCRAARQMIRAYHDGDRWHAKMNVSLNRKTAEARQAWFLWSVGVVLGATGLAKAFSAIGHARVLDTADPIFGIPFRLLFLLVGQTEFLIAFFCLFTDRRQFSIFAIAWISTGFILYRLDLWSIRWHHPCGCMGSLAGALHLSDHAADNIMKAVLAYLLVGSSTMLDFMGNHLPILRLRMKLKV